jgi:Xaa-Pro aminopeptidase
MAVEHFARRRAAFMQKMEGGVALFPSAHHIIRNRDVEFDFRQDSDFYYLTGFDEPESLLMLAPNFENPVTLFVRPRDLEKESWMGPRAGVDGAKSRYGADAAHPIADALKVIRETLGKTELLYYAMGCDDVWDDHVIEMMKTFRMQSRTGVRGLRSVQDPGFLLHEQRLIKGQEEIDSMARAAVVSAEGHMEAMRACRPGLNEAHLQSVLEVVFRTNGSKRQAYHPIVASGNNATVLHYNDNCAPIAENDLVLIDAGCEMDYLASDITRCFPASGKFSEAQRELYSVVLDSQRVAVEACLPGASFQSVHEKATEVLTQGLIDLNLIEGPLQKALDEELYKPFYWHRTSHWLGMDVHDVGQYFDGDDSRKLEPGMVLTVEPGLYVADSRTDVPDRYRGIGIRIEDDVLVTESSPRVLTERVPKEIDEIEAVMAEEPQVSWPLL